MLESNLIHCDTLRLFHTEECGSAGASVHPGDYTHEETHVPIPNTTVKLAGPMIVHTSAKVGYCREHFLKARSPDLAFFMRPSSNTPFKCWLNKHPSFDRSPHDVIRDQMHFVPLNYESAGDSSNNSAF